jgi:hypothetical protein
MPTIISKKSIVIEKNKTAITTLSLKHALIKPGIFAVGISGVNRKRTSANPKLSTILNIATMLTKKFSNPYSAGGRKWVTTGNIIKPIPFKQKVANE